MVPVAILGRCGDARRDQPSDPLPTHAPGLDRIVVLHGHEVGNATAAAFLRDGRIAVADGASQDIALYDTSGRFVRTVGARGRGPGEFLQLSWIAAEAGDAILAFDRSYGRVTVLRPNGQTDSTFQIPTLDVWPAPKGRLDDGTIVFLGNVTPRPTPRVGLIHDSSLIYVVNIRERRSVTQWGPLPTLQYYRADDLGVQGLSVGVPFAPKTSLAAAGTMVAYATGSDSIIVLADRAGRRIKALHAPLPAHRVSPADVAALRAQRHEGPGRQFATAYQRALDRLDPPHRAPVITDLLFASPDELLVAGWASVDAGTVPWVRLSTADSVLGTFSLPRNARVLAASGDRLVVAEENEDGAVSVVLYRFAATP
jgi:6-bladed beta-propeller protein